MLVATTTHTLRGVWKLQGAEVMAAAVLQSQACINTAFDCLHHTRRRWTLESKAFMVAFVPRLVLP